MPPYLEIVEEIRRRITDGELAPGDRIPSIRQLARQWNVAIATATKAVSELQRAGLVRAEPRVGAVVTVPEPRPGGPAPHMAERELTRDGIVRAAIEMADAEGLSATSMRGIAARLGVATMSPYRHVGGKDALVLLMADTVYGELGYPADPPDGWRARLELGARTLWALHKRHPWLVQVTPLNRPLALRNLATHAEWALTGLDALGLDPTTRLNLHVVLYAYIQGMAANLDREAQAQAGSGLSDEEWMDAEEPKLRVLLASGAYPAFAALLDGFTHGYDFDLDELFELGLRLQLDGLAALIKDRG